MTPADKAALLTAHTDVLGDLVGKPSHWEQQFYRLAHALVPALLEEIDRLKEENDKLTNRLEDIAAADAALVTSYSRRKSGGPGRT